MLAPKYLISRVPSIVVILILLFLGLEKTPKQLIIARKNINTAPDRKTAPHMNFLPDAFLHNNVRTWGLSFPPQTADLKFISWVFCYTFFFVVVKVLGRLDIVTSKRRNAIGLLRGEDYLGVYCLFLSDFSWTCMLRLWTGPSSSMGWRRVPPRPDPVCFVDI